MIPIRDSIPSSTRPRVVYTLLALNTFLFFAVSLFHPSWVEVFGLKPAYLLAWLDGDRLVFDRFPHRIVVSPTFVESLLPCFTSIFLHGSLLHLAGNMLFLWIFGDNIEDELGHIRFLAFYVTTGLLAGLCHVYVEPASVLPTIGASGAVAGLLGAYFVRFPHSRVLMLVPVLVLFTFEIPAYLFLGFWILKELFVGTLGIAGQIAVWAHIGGFAAGIALFWLFRPRRRGRNPNTRYRSVRFERIG